MQALGIERAPDVSEPEDHIAALCEMMAGLILAACRTGIFG
jgi:TorA maturation chaperone TorD